MRKVFTLCLAVVLMVSAPLTFAQEAKSEKPLIQIAILLDTSGSMEGLINQARTQLWKIVNELATAKRDGQTPELQVALYEYGKSSLPAEQGYLQKILDLTTDLDKVSEELFALKTNGGNEYCGWVIHQATQDLNWSKSNKDFKAIYIAGNEPFTQMPAEEQVVIYKPRGGKLTANTSANANAPQKIQQQVQVQIQPQTSVKIVEGEKPSDTSSSKYHYKVACKAAIESGIIVNTIHCGDAQTGINGMWEEGALLADGTFMNIDQNREIVHIKAPQDQEILKLNAQLNETYIAYGRAGLESKERQKKQDMNASGASYSGNLQRAVSKSSAHYKNSSWDIVDAVKEGEVDLDDMEEESLPENMKKMNVEERKTYIKEQEEKRKKIQEKIQELNKAREKYVATERKKLASEGAGDTLDIVMIKSLREQLTRKSYEVEK